MLQRERTLCGIQSPRRLFQLRRYRLILSEMTTEPQFSGRASILPSRSLRTATSTSCTRLYDQPPPVLAHPKPQNQEKLNPTALQGQPNLIAQPRQPQKANISPPSHPKASSPWALRGQRCAGSRTAGPTCLLFLGSLSLPLCAFPSHP